MFPFEKKYFENEKVNATFVGHPLLDDFNENKVDINHIIKNKNKVFSIYPGSRLSEINTLIPIIFDFVKMMNNKYSDFFFIFHSTTKYVNLIKNLILREGLVNCRAVSDKNIKNKILKLSKFALVKSGTISLEICNYKIPSIIIYKMNIVNFFIVKMLVKVRFANIINIAADKEVIPELLQSKCNSKNIFTVVDKLLNNKKSIDLQINESQKVIKEFKTKKSTEIASSILISYL